MSGKRTSQAPGAMVNLGIYHHPFSRTGIQQLRRTFAVIESVLFPGFLVEDISTAGGFFCD